MVDREDIIELFRKDKQADYDFSKAPLLISRKAAHGAELFDHENLSKWRVAQQSFIGWTKDKNIFTQEYIEEGKLSLDAFFMERGPLKGSVLDIGGGWGLYRQWWNPGTSDIFVVHDPGVERFLQGPHELHKEHYRRAFSLPMVFVEGFGEDLPYRDEIFDTCIIASTLDHCIYPKRVLAETYRCSKPGGDILAIQSCLSSQSGRSASILWRASKHLKNPVYLMAAIFERLLKPAHHLHHFTPEEMILLIKQAGFSDVRHKVVPTAQDITAHNVYAFEAEKK